MENVIQVIVFAIILAMPLKIPSRPPDVAITLRKDPFFTIIVLLIIFKLQRFSIPRDEARNENQRYHGFVQSQNSVKKKASTQGVNDGYVCLLLAKRFWKRPSNFGHAFFSIDELNNFFSFN